MSYGRNLELVPDGYCHVETYIPGDRSSFERMRCSTDTGLAEFLAEVKRVERIRQTFSEWETVCVVLKYGDTELQRVEVA